MTLLYEGKAKRISSINQENELGVEYKDEVTAGNGAKKDTMAGKRRSNNQIISIILKYLQENEIESHFIKQLSETEQLVEPVRTIPLEVVVRNIAGGSITKRLGFGNGEVFRKSLVGFFYKNDALSDLLIMDDHVKLLNIASDEDIEILKSKALKISNVLKQLMDAMNLKLIDSKTEFGKTETGQILLADEISPDTCRIWDKAANVNSDKNVCRNSTGSSIETYRIFLNELEDLKQ